MRKASVCLGILLMALFGFHANADEVSGKLVNAGTGGEYNYDFSDNSVNNDGAVNGNYVHNDVEDVAATYYARFPNEVLWTVREEMSATLQASRWGIPSRQFFELNPELNETSKVYPGQQYYVFKKDPTKIPRSIGHANRGRLSNGVPMPEGKGWMLRTYRPNDWGMPNTIEALTTTFNAYAERYPDAPPINIGDISRRRGGQLKPHLSHRSGRDIDFGYVVNEAPNDHRPENFIRASAENLDIEKTWFVIKTLIDTGEVQMMFMDSRIQKLLITEAKKTLSDEEIRHIFATPHHSESDTSIIRHWKGHVNHVHVRFKCPDHSVQCKK